MTFVINVAKYLMIYFGDSISVILVFIVKVWKAYVFKSIKLSTNFFNTLVFRKFSLFRDQ